MTAWILIGIGIAVFLIGLVFGITHPDVEGATVKLPKVEISSTRAAGAIIVVGLAITCLGAILVAIEPPHKTRAGPAIDSCRSPQRPRTHKAVHATRRTEVAYIAVSREHPFFAADVIVTVLAVSYSREGPAVTAKIRDAPLTRSPVVLRNVDTGTVKRFINKYEIAINCIDSHGARVTVADVS